MNTSGGFQAAIGGKMKSKKKVMKAKSDHGQQKPPPNFMMQASPSAGGMRTKKGKRKS